MSLSRHDLERIRAIVREELVRLSPATKTPLEHADEEERSTMRELARSGLAEMRRRSAVRAARPIPDTDYLATYDASRLSGILPDTLRGMAKRGVIASRKVKGRLEFSRADLASWAARHPRPAG